MNETLNYKDLPVVQRAFELVREVNTFVKTLPSTPQGKTVGDQLFRAVTSIGANIAEANGAISDADFSSKISIAYKECLETKYWLSLLKDTGYINEKTFESIFCDADELGKILFAILKTTRIDK